MAGVSTKDIKNRIRSMESTKQITKAMEMVAASKLRHAQARIAASRPYFEILRNTIDNIVDTNLDFSSPYLNPRTGNQALYIVIAGDRGLAGGYNINVLKLAMEEMEGKETTVLPIGRKTVDYFRSRQINTLTETYTEASEVDIGDCFRISKTISEGYLAEHFDEIHLVYTHFDSVLSQTAASIQLLPLVRKENQPPRESRCLTIYEPNAEEVFASIVPEYLGGILYGALSESRCAEQAARRTAMDAATRNAGDLISNLRQTYNRARQAAITQEITEIVAGTEA